MLITRTPMRVSLLGGGTDFPSFSREHGGVCVSMAINKYIEIAFRRRDDNMIYLHWKEGREVVADPLNIRHDLVREALLFRGWREGLEIAIFSDVPGGSGLGSSSSLAVGLMQGLAALQGDPLPPDGLYWGACELELAKLARPMGKQDQAPPSYGGLRSYKFHEDGALEQSEVYPVGTVDKSRQIDRHLMLFSLGQQREAGTVLGEQEERNRSGQNTGLLCQLKELTWDVLPMLRGGNLAALGQAMGKSWELKKALASNISDDRIDQAYQMGVDAGALGGKVCGAGAGGFLILFAEPRVQEHVRNAMPLPEVHFNMDRRGSRVVFDE